MKSIVFAIILILGKLSAEELCESYKGATTVSADHAEYHEQAIILTGQAVVSHELGILVADKMVLESRSKTSRPAFDYLQMDEHVDISLYEGRRLKCSKAVIDYTALTGLFLGSKSQERVMYSQELKDKKGQQLPLVIQGLEMEINFANEEVDNSEKTFISRMIVDGCVSLNYGSFIASSDHAIFNRKSFALTKEIFPGEITLNSQEGRLCKVKNGERDEIQCEKIWIDTTQRELVFSFPKGLLKSAGKGSNALDFIADKLIWKDQSSKLILSGNVEILDQGVGKLEAAEDVTIFLTRIEGKKNFRGIETYGQALLVYVDPEGKSDHVLKSYGSLRIDHQKMETKLQSPQNHNGISAIERQVYFKDRKGEIYADKAFIKYHEVNKKIAPVRIVLQGNVKIVNHLEQSENDKTLIEQYMLADRVDFIPQTKEMIIKASKGSRVLFFDKSNNLEISAPGLKLTRDQATRKETIKGIGDIRFNFVENELDKLNRHFLFHKMASGSEVKLNKIEE